MSPVEFNSLVLDPRIHLCSLDDQVVAYNLGSGNTHLLEGEAADLITRLAEGPISLASLQQLNLSGLQIPLSRLIMELEYLGIVRARECE
ncbi:HPr-rel-A system PqqD family peptide chaperone [Aestuariirhabdus sp. LZHN29]|uniref:HPr-rel-A system PqqD family peptide chaperone n=1 Tax=Aestuariirhabdus sp. LZHN29 TaxID=3417462 RepID=UPI003CF8145A